MISSEDKAPEEQKDSAVCEESYDFGGDILIILGTHRYRPPKKTMQFAQEIARVLAQFRLAAEQFQESALAPETRESIGV